MDLEKIDVRKLKIKGDFSAPLVAVKSILHAIVTIEYFAAKLVEFLHRKLPLELHLTS